MSTNPGRFPDPAGQRYQNGQHFAPSPPAVQALTVRAARRRPLIALEVFGGLVLIDSVAQHPWLLSVFTVIGVLFGAGFWVLKSAQQREEQQLHRADHECDPHGQYLPPDCG